jgi:hypothetical protein
VTPHKARFDLRRCHCGLRLGRALPADVSLCTRCFIWVGRRKTVTPKGVICPACDALEASAVATIRLREAGYLR